MFETASVAGFMNSQPSISCMCSFHASDLLVVRAACTLTSPGSRQTSTRVSYWVVTFSN